MDHHPCVFQVLDGGTNISRDVILSEAQFALAEVVLKVSFDLFNHNSPHSTGQGTNVRTLPTSKYIYPSYTFWDWGNSYSMNSGTHLIHYTQVGLQPKLH